MRNFEKKNPGGSRVIMVLPGRRGTPYLLPGGIPARGRVFSSDSCINRARIIESTYRNASTALRGPHPIFPEMLTHLQNNVQAAWLGALIMADGECSYTSFPHGGRRYYRARVRIGIYEQEPIGEAARLMGVSRMGPRKGRFEAEAQGSRAIAVLTKISPYILGRKSAEAHYIVQHGGHVTEQVYRDFQQRFPTLRRMQGKMAWRERKGMVLRAGRSGPLGSF